MENIYKQAVNLQFKSRDYCDDQNHPKYRQLKNDIQRLVDEIEMKKNPRTLEDRVQQLIRQLNNMDGSTAMSDHHVYDLKDRCEDLRDDLRKLM